MDQITPWTLQDVVIPMSKANEATHYVFDEPLFTYDTDKVCDYQWSYSLLTSSDFVTLVQEEGARILVFLINDEQVPLTESIELEIELVATLTDDLTVLTSISTVLFEAEKIVIEEEYIPVNRAPLILTTV